ncbi:hypothetical protein, partial [Streptomyces sp. SolWspMP-sol7th]|uniref:hypothetical protein n=1 Tax=Streptomyces sp. SolWspMP-sol7th TaxID=1839776 RepID=UPI001C314045
QLLLLRQIPDPAQVVEDELISLDPHRCPSTTSDSPRASCCDDGTELGPAEGGIGPGSPPRTGIRGRLRRR